MAFPPAERPPIQHFTDPHGRACVRVPLDRHGNRWATVMEADYHRAMALDPTPWRADEHRPGKFYVRGNSRGPRVARIVAHAGIGEQIVHVDGDTFNLLPENLVSYRNRCAKRVAA